MYFELLYPYFYQDQITIFVFTVQFYSVYISNRNISEKQVSDAFVFLTLKLHGNLSQLLPDKYQEPIWTYLLGKSYTYCKRNT